MRSSTISAETRVRSIIAVAAIVAMKITTMTRVIKLSHTLRENLGETPP
jgi:hypothetical protein